MECGAMQLAVPDREVGHYAVQFGVLLVEILKSKADVLYSPVGHLQRNRMRYALRLGVSAGVNIYLYAAVCQARAASKDVLWG